MIMKLSEQYSTRTLCRVLDCSVSAYYSWKNGHSGKREFHKRRLTALIRTTYFGSKKTYGSPRIYQALKAESVRCSRSHIIRIMQQQGLAGIQRRKYCVTTQSDHDLPVADNILNRDFKAEKVNQKWVSDISYIRTNEGWLYLAVVIDLFSRKVVGWSMDTRMKTDLVIAALRMAIRLRKPGPGLIHHSDRGVQYASYKYQNELTRAKMICSMSRKGNCWDNSVAESFFSSLKRESVYPSGTFTGINEARSSIFSYIEGFYNRSRKHSYLGYVSPEEFELDSKNVILKNVA